MTLGIEFACLALLCQSEQPKGPEAFVGSSGCRTELRSEGSEYGMRLDRKQNARVEVRKIQGKTTQLVIQYADNKDQCRTIRDIVVAPGSKDVFELERIDNVDPKRVVVGVHPDGPPFPGSWKASKAWVVDFERLRLTLTNDSVTCMNSNGAGADDGSDLRTWSAARTKKKAH